MSYTGKYCDVRIHAVILLLHLRTALYLQLTGLFFQTQRSIDLYYILRVDIGLWREILSSTDQYLV